jgi:hypothetical protein
MDRFLPRWSACAACPSRRNIIRVNRLFGWALLLSPALQWAAGVRFLHGLAFDLGLLLVHSVLSLAIYGLPSATEQERWKLWVGLRPRGLSPRNEFLLTGWRVFLVAPYVLVGVAAPLVSVTLGWPGLWLLIPGLWLWIRLPFTVFSHIVQAVGYAARRWGLCDGEGALTLGICLAIAFYACTVVNLLR